MTDDADDEPEESPADSKYELIDHHAHAEIYALCDELVQAHHSSDLCEARIALAWIYNVKADRDGHLLLGRARKVSELEQQFHAHDFVILLNHKAWQALPEASRRALLDHELSHCAAATNDDGETRYYMRRHDLEEFSSVVRRHGLWSEAAQAFVKAAEEHEANPLFAPAQAAVAKLTDTLGKIPGVSRVTLSSGGKSVTLTSKKQMP